MGYAGRRNLGWRGLFLLAGLVRMLGVVDRNVGEPEEKALGWVPFLTKPYIAFLGVSPVSPQRAQVPAFTDKASGTAAV